MSKPIYLLGFMGTGKSVVGKRLAEVLGYQFIDLDEYIESKEQNSISSIFSIKGEAYFRKVEHKNLVELSTKRDIVISLGGGAPCLDKNINIIRTGTSIFIKSSLHGLTNRLFAERQKRPLIHHLNSKNALYKFIKVLLQKRKSHYDIADFSVWNRGSLDVVVQKILKKF